MIFLTPSRLIVLALIIGVMITVFSALIPDTGDRIGVEYATGTLLEVHRPEGEAGNNPLFASLGLIELDDGTRTRLPLGNNPPAPGASIELEVWLYDNGERIYRLRQDNP